MPARQERQTPQHAVAVGHKADIADTAGVAKRAMVGEHASGWRSGRQTRQARQCAGGRAVAEWAIALREVERLRQHQPSGSG